MCCTYENLNFNINKFNINSDGYCEYEICENLSVLDSYHMCPTNKEEFRQYVAMYV